MDKLDEIYELQTALRQRYGVKTIEDDSTTLAELFETIKQKGLAISMEAAEIINWTPWKPWSKQIGSKDPEWPIERLGTDDHLHEIKMEVVDVLHFAIELAQVLGMTAGDIHAMYVRKNKVNHVRQDEGY